MAEVDLDELARLEAAATPGPWMFRSGNDRNGDSCDLLMAEVGQAEGDEDPEYAEVLFGGELSSATYSANWELVPALRNAAPSLIAELRRLRKIEAAARKVSTAKWLALEEALDGLDAALATGETEKAAEGQA